MDDSTLKQTLRAIGQEAVPENWNRWDEIQRRVQEESMFSRPVPARRWLKRVAALLAVMLVSTGAIYAFVQINLPTGDTGLDGVKEAGLVTDLNLAQTIDGVQVQLNWGYIDEGRAVLNFETYLVDEDGSKRLADADEPAIVRLRDRNGVLPDLYPNRFGSASYPLPITVAFYLIQQGADVQGDSVDLQFEIIYTQRPLIRNALERIFYSGVRRSDFGWNESANPISLPSDAMVFTFDFTLPVQPAVELEPMQTVTASGIPMTLQSIHVSPSHMDYRLCYTLPENMKKGWHVSRVSLSSDAALPPLGGMESRLENGLYCLNGYFDVYTTLPVTLTLEVEALERFASNTSPEELLAVQREMNARGIDMDVNVNSDGMLGGFTWPNNTEESQAVLVDLGYRIEGPWVFTIDVPAPDAE